LAYNYTPYKNQNALPDFDSEKMSNTYENLFSGKKYTGLDKISKANDITFGLESDFIDQKTGETYLALKIAQAHYLDKKAGKNYSNIVAGADLTMQNQSPVMHFGFYMGCSCRPILALMSG
jgi:LPS-assembly protein